MSSVTPFNPAAALADIHREREDALANRRWDPPAGQYKLLLTKFQDASPDVEKGIAYPVYRLKLEVLENPEFKGRMIGKYFSWAPSNQRAYQLLEWEELAAAAHGGILPVEVGPDGPDYLAMFEWLRTACDGDDKVVLGRVHYVPDRKEKKDEATGEIRMYARYEYSPLVPTE